MSERCRDIGQRRGEGKPAPVRNPMGARPDTIFALSSGAGRAGIAVIRVSGPGAKGALSGLTGRPLPVPRQATRARLSDPRSAEVLDDALVLWFPAPASYTGEDVAELHIHGGRAVIADVLDALGGQSGLRLAEPGEFTRRAFDNGRLDLTAAEGVADLVSAQTAAQRRQALRQMDGALAQLYEDWRARLIAIMARIEAGLEFPDEDLPERSATGEVESIAAIAGEIGAHLAGSRRGEAVREGISIAIVGAPNAGKSSLLNRLARREAAIVSSTAGTTRDVVEVQMDLRGYPVIVADTAGLRAANEDVEAEGVRRSLARANTADVRLAMFDASEWPSLDQPTRALVDGDTIVVLNKCDLRRPPANVEVEEAVVYAVSALTEEGVAELLEAIGSAVSARFAAREAPVLTRARHKQALQDCSESLARAQSAAMPELMAEDVRMAARALGRITGCVDVEDVLDALFSEFCIGK